MPKIIGGSLREHREQTRHRLFAALSTLMSERGFDAISFADIAAAAGVGRTAVYNHFADKEALLIGFIAHETEQYMQTLNRALTDAETPLVQLQTYVRAQLGLKRVFHLAPGTDLRTILSRPSQQRLRDHVVAVEALLTSIITAGVEDGTFPGQDIPTTVSLVSSCLSGKQIPERDPERGIAIKATEDFVLRAVGA
ncbi:TetR/AcrR family transcriptional regulator [Rarobacter faecitabidus]|uniref:TetR family transcriptional regulator n=1 Tax=Rarobacter faecitabidus TaxID=13243 RepID=A0A542ZP02_RARFA|nr:TetR/AcrR family transcriptional regulator [Rarobacter faecitabidus]TQL62101.1 TetR family transcriptional regulator [Rarobacter faecitabidus]